MKDFYPHLVKCFQYTKLNLFTEVKITRRLLR
jgi:hypothetical protein